MSRKPVERPDSFRNLVALPLVLLVSGCGGGDALPREAVHGSVMMAGKPLESGNIVFQPAEQTGEITPVAGTIRDGGYSIPRAEGPIPGNYRVSITSPKPDASRPVRPGLSADDGGEPPMKETVSPRQNAKTELKASVERGGSNTFDFTVDPAK